MSGQPLTYAALLTTGPSPGEDRVVEAAAVRREPGGEPREFQSLADPGAIGALSALVDLNQEDLAGKPSCEEALERLAEFCDSTTLVTFDTKLFRGFFEAEGLRAPECLDALQLARVAAPRASDYSLAGVAGELGMEGDTGCRALPQARLLARIWEGLIERLSGFPPAVLDAVCRLAEAAGHPLASVLAEAGDGEEFELRADPAAGLLEVFPDRRNLFRRVQRHEQEKPDEEPLPTEKICQMFAPDGLVGRHLAGYEHRPQQVQMVEAVCRALGDPHHLMVEAGTGTGKSMAYLLPAIAWCCVNGDRVVVSTNTRNLQEQLHTKDLPFLEKLLPDRFEAALLKGRRNYLCVRRFAHLMRHFQRELAEPEEFMALASLVTWAADTEAGDLAECNGFAGAAGAPSVRAAVVSGSEECAGRACPLRGRCLVRRARALAQLADIIVVNHALLFAEIGTPVLPEYRCVVFDEAQNLEDVATDAFSVAVNNLSIYRVTNLLYRKRQDGSGGGLLAVVMHEADEAVGSEAARSELLSAAGDGMEAVEDVVEAARQFFELLGQPFEEMPPYVDRILLAECAPALGPGSEAWEAAGRLREEIHSLGEKVESAADLLEPAAEESGQIAGLVHDLRSALERLRAVSEDVEFILAQEEENFVYWLERTRRRQRSFHSLHAAPLQVGDYMREYFFAEKRCVIFTSATLQVDGDYDYMLQRLGGDQLPAGLIECLAVGSPFDYDRQSMVGVTTFLPDPGGQRDRAFDRQLSKFLTDLLRKTRGRALVLFTSYSLLEAVYEAVKEPLERAGISVLAQGHTGSRGAITAFFSSVPSSVLLGTRSFWEGVDIAGETLSCLVLTKLPFHVFTDPLVRGRIGYLEVLGQDPFRHYTLPEAVISFRQGFGRLIRRNTDRGVVLVADRRMVTKDYGRVFLRSLPTEHRVLTSPEEALEAVEQFFRADAVRSAPAPGKIDSPDRSTGARP